MRNYMLGIAALVSSSIGMAAEYENINWLTDPCAQELSVIVDILGGLSEAEKPMLHNGYIDPDKLDSELRTYAITMTDGCDFDEYNVTFRIAESACVDGVYELTQSNG